MERFPRSSAHSGGGGVSAHVLAVIAPFRRVTQNTIVPSPLWVDSGRSKLCSCAQLLTRKNDSSQAFCIFQHSPPLYCPRSSGVWLLLKCSPRFRGCSLPSLPSPLLHTSPAHFRPPAAWCQWDSHRCSGSPICSPVSTASLRPSRLHFFFSQVSKHGPRNV